MIKMIPEVSLKMLERSGVIKGGINTIRQNPTQLIEVLARTARNSPLLLFFFTKMVVRL